MKITHKTSHMDTSSEDMNDRYSTSNYNQNDSSKLMCTALLNVQKDKINNDFEYNDMIESSKILPTTPSYSDSPLNTIDDISSNFECISDVGPSPIRFFVLIIAATAFFLQVFSQSIWSAIYESALVAFPRWDSRSFSLLPIWGSIMSAILVFPACLTINKYGLKVSLLWSCSFFTLGTAVRCLPSIYKSTTYLHVSAIFLSFGGVFMTPLMITISAQWFPKNERNMATGFGSAVGMLGSATTYIIGPMVVSAVEGDRPIDPYMVQNQIMRMLYVCFGFNLLVIISVFLFFPKEIRPVTFASKLSMASQQSAKLVNSLKVLVTDIDMWCLVMAFTLSNTISTPWFALLPSTASKLHVPAELSAKCSFFMILHTFVMSLSISTFADHNPGFSKEIALFIRSVSLVFLFWMMLMINFHAKLTTTFLVCVVLMGFPYSWCTQSLLYEMGAELMYPLPESFVAGYMTLLNNLFVDFTYTVLYIFPNFVEYWLHIGVFGFSVVSMIFLIFTTDPRHTRKYSKNSN